MGDPFDATFASQIEGVFAVTLRNFASEWAELTDQKEPVKAYMNVGNEALSRDLHNLSNKLVERINLVLDESDDPVPQILEPLGLYNESLKRIINMVKGIIRGARVGRFPYINQDSAEQVFRELEVYETRVAGDDADTLRTVGGMRLLLTVMDEIRIRLNYLLSNEWITPADRDKFTRVKEEFSTIFVPRMNSVETIARNAAAIINEEDLSAIQRLVATIEALGPKTRSERDSLRQDVDWGTINIRQWLINRYESGDTRMVSPAAYTDLNQFVSEFVTTASPNNLLTVVLGVRAYSAIRRALYLINSDRNMPPIPSLGILFRPERMAIDSTTGHTFNATLYDEFMNLCVAVEMRNSARRIMAGGRNAASLRNAQNQELQAVAIFRDALRRLSG